MAVSTDKTGQIVAKSSIAPPTDLVSLLLKIQPEIARAVPKQFPADRMGRIAMTALRTVNHLADCTPVSFMASLMTAAQLGLEVNTPLGHSWLIPRRNTRLSNKAQRDVYEATLMVGYQGLLDLSYRTGMVKSARARVVREGDYFEYSLGLVPKLEHKPAEDAQRNKRPVKFAWAVIDLVSGGSCMDVLSYQEIEARRALSPSANNGPWVTHYEPMACKTAIKAATKYAPRSSEAQRLLAMDDAAEGGVELAQVVDPDVIELMQRYELTFDSPEVAD